MEIFEKIVFNNFTYLCKLFKDWIPLGIGKLSSCKLNQCNAEGPDVGADVVAARSLRVNALGRHVGPAAGVPGLCDAVHQLARDSEVAQFYCSSLEIREIMLMFLY